MLKRVAAVAFALGLSAFLQPAVAAEGTAPKSRLSGVIAAELGRFPSRSGFYAKNLTTGEEASFNGDTHFETASTIKLATLVLAFRMVDDHKLDLNERIVLKPSDLRGGSGIFRFKGPGLNPSVRDLLTEMVITSDNTATDLMMGKVGGVVKIAEFMRASGYQATRPNFTTGDYFKGIYERIDPKYKSLSAEDVFALCCSQTTLPNFPALPPAREALVKEVRETLANRRTVTLLPFNPDETTWFGISTPNEMGRLLESIEKGTAASAASCDEMRRMLRNTVSSGTAVASALGLYLSVPFGHKTGDTGGVTNDVGIVYSKTGPIVMASYNNAIVGPTEQISEKVGRVAQLVVEYFEGNP